MKKVRIIGALGVAPMAMGVALPAAHLAAAITHSPKNAAKTVSLLRGHEPRPEPLVECGSGHTKKDTSTHGHLTGSITYSHRCVYFQSAVLNRNQTGLTERVRFYSQNLTLERTTWQRGRAFLGSTTFHSAPNMIAYEVCQALVANSNHNDVKYGPVCETATS